MDSVPQQGFDRELFCPRNCEKVVGCVRSVFADFAKLSGRSNAIGQESIGLEVTEQRFELVRSEARGVRCDIFDHHNWRIGAGESFGTALERMNLSALDIDLDQAGLTVLSR